MEHVPPAAKREQIKGQRNPLELEVRFLSTGPACKQHLSGCISAWNLDQGLVYGRLLPSELSFQSILALQHFIAQGTSVFYMFHKHMIHIDVGPALHAINIV